MKKLIYILLFFPALVLSQSTNQNYVKSVTYKKKTTSALSSNPAAEDAVVNVTYFDGLGRPVQQIAHKQSGEGKDIITHIEYDALGRQAKEYLPYASNSQSDMGYIDGETAKSETTDYYDTHFNDTFPFSEKSFEPSPLNRVLKQGAPGADWQIGSSNDHTVKFGYQTNKANEVKLFKVSASAAPNSYGVYTTSLVNSAGTTYYAAGQLYKTVVTDENGSKTEEFKDKEGRVVLKRAYDGSVKHDTYYVYDIYGNLSYVIPPKAVDKGSITTAVLNTLCYQYRYDARNRLVEKKIPGRGTNLNYALGWEYMVYDKLDRVVATGPALPPFSNQTGNGWLITKYDALGRVAYTGWSMVNTGTSSANRHSLQTSVNGMTNLYVTNQNSTVDNVPIGYSNNSTYPADLKLLTVNYYDNYTYPGAPSSIPATVEGEHVTLLRKGLATGSWVRVLTKTTETYNELNYTLYDDRARPIRAYTKNHLNGYTQTDSKLDFTGHTLYTITRHKRENSNDELAVREDFEYTPQSRLLRHTHKINSGTTETLSHNSYDPLGQLITKKTGRTESNPLQMVDYNYNIRGWLTDINNVESLGTDLFAFKINYNQINETFPQYVVPKLYNGNISETVWITSTDNQLRGYSYDYDGLNRLHSAHYNRLGTTLGSLFSFRYNNYSEYLSYDKNGNIITLQRNGDLENTSFLIEIDDLEYTYDDGNRLKKVTDSTNHPEGFTDGADSNEEYLYDNYGNMVTDDNKGISQITYNHLNLPKEIKFSGTPTRKISYLYNALGQKVQKVITNGLEITTTDYLSGFHYENNGLKFFATAEGYVNVSLGIKKGSAAYSYVYNYTDHLGNIRLSYTSVFNLLTGNQELRVMEENHYYPFGLKHKKYGSVNYDFVIIDEETEEGYYVGIDIVPPGVRKTYQYKYQGQERQDELGLNWDSFKWRNYDFAIGRFMSIDPLSEKYEWQSVYSFSSNQPVHAPEIEGLESSNDKSLMSRIADSFGFDIFRHQQDLKYAQTPQERTAIGNRIENSQARLQGTATGIEYMTYAVAAGGLAPWAAIGGAYAAPYVGGALASGYGSYSTWFAGTQLSSYISTAGYGGLAYQVFGTNSIGTGLLNATVSAGGDYISGGFDHNKVDIVGVASSALFKNGFTSNLLSSSMYSTGETNFNIEFYNSNQFSTNAAFGTIGNKVGSSIESLKIPQFSKSLGTFMETTFKMGADSANKIANDKVLKELPNGQ